MDWPAGIRPRGRGIQIRVWRRGKLVYTETLQGDPYKKADLAAAVKRRGELIARQRLGLPLFAGDDGAETFAVLAERWLASLQIDDYTIRKYWNHINRHWMPAYASWPVDEITQADIKERLAATGLSIKTQKNILGPLRGVLAHGGVNPNPANGITWAKRQRPPVDRYRPEERDRLLSKLAGQDLVYFALLLATGLRPGEALGLEWSDYDGEMISVTKQYTRSQFKAKTKTGQRRTVFVPSWARPILNNHTSRFAEGAIFLNTEGEPLKDSKRLNKAWKKAHKKARVPYRIPYTCRHTRAAELLSRGVAPAEAAAQLGHSPQMFLEIYSEFIDEYAERQDMSRFEGVTEQTPNRNRGQQRK